MDSSDDDYEDYDDPKSDLDDDNENHFQSEMKNQIRTRTRGRSRANTMDLIEEFELSLPGLPQKGKEKKFELDELSVASLQNLTKQKSKYNHQIDYVGTGTFQLPQLNIFNSRALEGASSIKSQLSARGVHHRSRDDFEREVQLSTLAISNIIKSEKMVTGGSVGSKPSPKFFMPFFQRAIGHERLGNISKAIKDYSSCLSINSTHALSYFNRGRLYKLKNEIEKAKEDFNKAIFFDPSNSEFRRTRSLLYRELGLFDEAIKDTISYKSLSSLSPKNKTVPTISSTLKKQGSLDDLPQVPTIEYNEKTNELSVKNLKKANPNETNLKFSEDPIYAALATPPGERTLEELEPIIDFLRILKFFNAFMNNFAVLSEIASKVSLITYQKDEVIFKEKDPGNHFFIILDGQIDIIKVKHIDPNTGNLAGTLGSLPEDDPAVVQEVSILVKIFRGQTFGETALESKGGRRTAGAVAGQMARLLVLHVDEYLNILSEHRKTLKDEVLSLIKSCSVFKSWNQNQQEVLASFAIVKNYTANSIIIQEGEPIPGLMIIKFGLVQLMKKIQKPETTEIKKMIDTKNEIEEYNEVPGLWILEKADRDTYNENELKLKNSKANKDEEFLYNFSSFKDENDDKINFTTNLLGSGQIFNEYAVIDHNKVSPVTAKAYTSVEIFCFENEILTSTGARHFNKTILKLYDSLRLNNPPEDKISYMFRSKLSWEIRKNNFFQYTNINKKKSGRDLTITTMKKKKKKNPGMFPSLTSQASEFDP